MTVKISFGVSVCVQFLQTGEIKCTASVRRTFFSTSFPIFSHRKSN